MEKFYFFDKEIIKKRLCPFKRKKSVKKFLFTLILNHLILFNISGQLNKYEISYSNDGYFMVKNKKTGKWGYTDTLGKEVIKCKYEYACYFSEGLAAVRENSKWGFINKSGTYVIPNIYDSTSAKGNEFDGTLYFSNGITKVILNGKAIFIDKKGKKIKDCPYEKVESFSSGIAAVKLNEKWGFIDASLKQIIPCIYDGIPMFPGMSEHYPNIPPRFSETGLCVVAGEFRSFYTVIDKTGRQLIPWTSKYIHVPVTKNYLSSICINGKYGFINDLGLIEIPCIYDKLIFYSESSEICTFQNDGILAVEKNGKFGYINTKGQTIIPFIYDYARPFEYGKARVEQNGMEFYINSSGQKL